MSNKFTFCSRCIFTIRCVKVQKTILIPFLLLESSAQNTHSKVSKMLAEASILSYTDSLKTSQTSGNAKLLATINP